MVYRSSIKITLTDRELEYLANIASGMSCRAIAKMMGLSTRTVEFYVEHLKNKTGCASKLELIVWAIKSGLTDGARKSIGRF
jgi:DNA-binding CsgD family transcriptional regulator